MGEIWARYRGDIGEMDGSWRWEMGPPPLFPLALRSAGPWGGDKQGTAGHKQGTVTLRSTGAPLMLEARRDIREM